MKVTQSSECVLRLTNAQATSSGGPISGSCACLGCENQYVPVLVQAEVLFCMDYLINREME